MYGLYESEFILVVGWLVVCMYVCISVQRAKVYIVYKLAQECSCACTETFLCLHRNMLAILLAGTESCWPFYWLARNHAGPIVCTAGLVCDFNLFACLIWGKFTLHIITIINNGL